MRIAYVYDAVYPFKIGGVEQRIFELSRRLAARGHEVHVYGLKTWAGESSFIDGTVIYHGVGKTLPFYRNGHRSVGEAVYFGYAVLKPLVSERFDIIDCQNFPYFSCLSSLIASWVKNEHLVITWHEVWGDYWYGYLGRSGFCGKVIEKIVSSFSENTIVVSSRTGNELLAIKPDAKIYLVPNGIDLQRIAAVRKSEEHSDILFAGRLIPEKRVDLLINAVRIIKGTLPGIRCVIIGDGPAKQDLSQLIKDQGLETNIRITGFIADYNSVIALMKSSLVFVSPSGREGFGIAALEALACGLPVVTVDSPKNAVRDLIEEGRGIICAASPEEVASSIITCIEGGAVMRAECIRYAMSYDWDEIVRSLENYYLSVVS